MEVRNDSRVIVGHIQWEYEEKEEKMKKYVSKVRELITQFKRFAIKNVPVNKTYKPTNLLD